MKNYRVCISFVGELLVSHFANVVVKANNIKHAYDLAEKIIEIAFSKDFNYTIIEVSQV